MAILDIFKIAEYQSTIRTLESENRSLKFKETNNLSTIQNLQSKAEEATELQAEVAELQAEVAELQNFIHSRLPFFEVSSLPAFNNWEALQEFWHKCWGELNHDDYHKLARQQRASKASLTPLDLDTKKGIAHFRGSERDYKTTLSTCECMDFQRHALPCKHMYRLAYELDIFMLNKTVESVPEPSKLFHQNDFNHILNNLSKNDRALIFHISCSPDVVRRTEALRLLDLKLIVISTDKHLLLDHFKRDELFALLPSDASVKKNCRKAYLIEFIISAYPNIIAEIEKLTIHVQLSPYAACFKSSILDTETDNLWI